MKNGITTNYTPNQNQKTKIPGFYFAETFNGFRLNSLYPLISQNGMEWMYRNCSTTAQRGAIDWSKKFEEKLIPMIEECYESVKNNTELNIIMECNKNPDYNVILDEELDTMSKQELWRVSKQIKDITYELNTNTNNIQNSDFINRYSKHDRNWLKYIS